MGFIWLFSGILFLFNPILRTFDFLPDVIGCILIIAGLSKLSALDDRLSGARKYIYYLTVLSAVKLPASFYLIVRAKNYLLPCSLIFSALEIILMIGFFVSLFGGLEYLISRDSECKQHIKRSESASVACFIFAIARGVCAFVPELLALVEQKDGFDYTYRPTPEQNAALIKPYAELLCFVLILIFGIYCAVACGKFLIGILRDKDFCTKLLERYKRYELENAAMYTLRRVKLSLAVLFIGILLLHNQILDYVNVIPNVFAFVFFAIGVFLLSKCEEEKSFKLFALFVLLVPLSLYNNVVQYRLLSATDIDIMGEHMTVRSVPEVLHSTESFVRIALASILEYAIVAVLLFLIMRKILKLPGVVSDDTISIFAVAFGISCSAYLASSVLVYIMPFVRTAYSYITNDIKMYIHYDSILGICEWTSYITFVIMLYSAYKFGLDIIFSVKADKKL